MNRVTRRFPRRDFVSVGAFPAERIGLSARRSTQLTLIVAWTRAAGPRLAAKAVPQAIRGGVLELRLTETDESWTRTLLDCIPGLGAVIASAHPRLGIEMVRLVAPDGSSVGPALPLAARAAVDADHVSHRSPQEKDAGEIRPPRLERVMRAYLERSGSSSAGD